MENTQQYLALYLVEVLIALSTKLRRSLNAAQGSQCNNEDKLMYDACKPAS